jgi:hypothetical protein
MKAKTAIVTVEFRISWCDDDFTDEKWPSDQELKESALDFIVNGCLTIAGRQDPKISVELVEWVDD